MSRADRVAARLPEAEVDLLLVTARPNVRYLTGFTGSNGFAVVGAEVRRFVTDFRYVEQARDEVDGFDVEQGPREILTALTDGWPSGTARLGFEATHLTVRQHARLRELVPAGIELVETVGVMEAERAVKEPGELAAIRAAAALADEIFPWVAERGLVGRLERTVAIELEHEMRLRGAEEPSFPSIVAAGAHGALPHASPRDVPIPPDTLVTLDLGVRLDGYCSDCTRTWATGSLPDDFAELYALCLRAQAVGLEAVRAGRGGREVDAEARTVIEEAGHGEHFGHGLGHGVGLEVHEAPRLSPSADDTPLAAGNVVTVEPGIYLPGRGGVRIEDLVVVTPDGVEVVSSFPKALLTVG